jgi:chorismate-pyruvate lyase
VAEGFRLTMNSIGGKTRLERGEPWSERDALVRELSRRIALARTATAALLAWCDEHRLSHGPIMAKRLQGDRTLPAKELSLPELGAPSEEPLCHRRVELVRGNLPLVTADNWFLPARLSPEMNDVLGSTDLPFGAVVAPLDPKRRNASIHFCDPGDGAPWGQETILEHRAIVLSGDGEPLAAVRERFRVELVSFPSYPTTTIR